MLVLYSLALAAQCVSKAPAALRGKDTPVAQCTKWCTVANAERQCGWCKCQACSHCKTEPPQPGQSQPTLTRPEQPRPPATTAHDKYRGKSRSRTAQQPAPTAAIRAELHEPVRAPPPPPAAAELAPLAAVFVIAFILALLLLLVKFVFGSQGGGDGGGWSALSGDVGMVRTTTQDFARHAHHENSQ